MKDQIKRIIYTLYSKSHAYMGQIMFMFLMIGLAFLFIGIVANENAHQADQVTTFQIQTLDCEALGGVLVPWNQHGTTLRYLCLSTDFLLKQYDY